MLLLTWLYDLLQVNAVILVMTIYSIAKTRRDGSADNRESHRDMVM